MGDGEGHHPTLSSPEQGVPTCFSSGNPQRGRQSPLLCPQLLPDPCLYPACVQAVWLPGGTVFLLFPPSTTWLAFRAQPWALNFGDPPNVDLCWSSWGGSCRAFAAFWFVPEIDYTTMQWFRVYGKAQQKADIKVCCSLSSYAREQDSSTQPSGFFLSPDSCAATPKCTPRRGTFLPMQPRGSSDHATHSWLPALLPTGTLTRPPDTGTWLSHWPPEHQTLPSAAYKEHAVFSPCPFLSQ